MVLKVDKFLIYHENGQRVPPILFRFSFVQTCHTPVLVVFATVNEIYLDPSEVRVNVQPSHIRILIIYALCILTHKVQRSLIINSPLPEVYNLIAFKPAFAEV